MNMTQAQAAKLQAFLVDWLRAVVPGLQNVRVCRRDGTVKARDALGWRDVGTVFDFLSIARALGRI